jgi:hypothetical protein
VLLLFTPNRKSPSFCGAITTGLPLNTLSLISLTNWKNLLLWRTIHEGQLHLLVLAITFLSIPNGYLWWIGRGGYALESAK